eukprot:gene13508-19369_t
MTRLSDPFFRDTTQGGTTEAPTTLGTPAQGHSWYPCPVALLVPLPRAFLDFFFFDAYGALPGHLILNFEAAQPPVMDNAMKPAFVFYNSTG